MKHGLAFPGLGVLVIAAGLSGCATMTPEQCMTADWYQIGEMDGRQGQGLNHFADRASVCREAGYPADQRAWQSGWDQGIIYFCTEDSGFRHGLEGHSYGRVCPGPLEGDFMAGYDVGRNIHQIESSLRSAERDYDRIGGRYDRLVLDPEADQQELRRLQREMDRLERRIRQLELELASARGVAQGRGFRL